MYLAILLSLLFFYLTKPLSKLSSNLSLSHNFFISCSFTSHLLMSIIKIKSLCKFYMSLFTSESPLFGMKHFYHTRNLQIKSSLILNLPWNPRVSPFDFFTSRIDKSLSLKTLMKFKDRSSNFVNREINLFFLRTLNINVIKSLSKALAYQLKIKTYFLFCI